MNMNIKWISIGSGALLLLGIFNLPYGYYIFLRWAILISAVATAYYYYNIKLPAWGLVFGGIAFVFNPIYPIYLEKSTWIILDSIAAGLFFYGGYLKDEKTPNVGNVLTHHSDDIKKENIIQRFFHKHETYFSGIYQTAFVIGYIWSGITLLRNIFDSIRSGDFLAFVIYVIFSSLFMMLQGLMIGIFLGTILTLALFIPYLIIRGLKN